MARQVTGFQWRYEVRVRVAGPPNAVSTRLQEWGRVVPDGPDRCIVETGGDDLNWIAWYLGTLPWEVCVEHPPELAEAFRSLGARFLRAAGPASTTS